ncbi:SDR family oxidoreductase [Thermodesulfobacteriota bacterium]
MRSIEQLLDLTGRKALITGGAGHIGRTAAETLIELGARVALLDVDVAVLEEKADTMTGFRSSRSITTEVDLLSENRTRDGVKDVIRQLEGIDIIIHSAGYVASMQADGWAVPFEGQQVAAWDAAIRVNLTSAFILVQEARPCLKDSGNGSVILVSSIYGMSGPDLRLYEETDMNNPAGYNASKGGLLQLTRYLATVLAPEVRVNAISPGGIWRSQPEAFRERYEDRTPLKRMAVEEDLKGAVAYLASDLSAYVTGHNLVVDGGWTTW